MAWWGGKFESSVGPTLKLLRTGDWLGVAGVDFGAQGSDTLTVSLNSRSQGGVISVYLDSVDGKYLGSAEAPVAKDDATYTEVRVKTQKVTGVHDLFFVAGGNGLNFKSWSFKPIEK
jgi:arabinoxylan arabinofuranohydrolase